MVMMHNADVASLLLLALIALAIGAAALVEAFRNGPHRQTAVFLTLGLLALGAAIAIAGIALAILTGALAHG